MAAREKTSIAGLLLAFSWCGFVALASCGSPQARTGGSGGGGGASNDAGGTGSADGGGTGGGGSGGGGPGCDAVSCEAGGGMCVGPVCTIVENPGNVPAGTQGGLGSGGSADAAFKFLYPYDATVFPRGLLAPLLQFDGTAPDAVYVHITSAGLDYKGYFGASNPGRVRLADPQWKAITLAAQGAKDPLTVEVTKSSGGNVTGPIKETWTIAQGNIRGTIYYETYNSQILGGANSVGLMKMQPGASMPVALKSGCANVCHTASADGSTLVSATSSTAGGGGLGWTSVSYDLKNNLAVRKQQTDQLFIYGGLYPDGSILLSATNFRDWSGLPSKLYDVTSGAIVAAPGWDGVVTHAAMPAFSPDGKKAVFNHEDTGMGKSLAVMDFAVAGKTFSNLVDVVTDPTSYLGWPAFTPDAKMVVYHAGSNNAFETDNNATGELRAVDIASKTAVRLDLLDGYRGGAVYLPANDPHLDFAPTLLPEAVGGYFWVVFTSHRSYGNTSMSKASNDQAGKLWVAAIDINATPGSDPSHPAFYLDGQEDTADNLRGFWVLDACKQIGVGCTSGDECCGGFCRMGDTGTVCVDQPPGCSMDYEACKTAADCCNTSDQCINGKCGAVIP